MDLMKIDFLPYAIAWGVLGLIVLVLALLRRKVADKEDDSLKLSEGETAHLAKQEQLAKKLAKIEMWGKSATIVLIATGVALGLLYGCLLYTSRPREWPAPRYWADPGRSPPSSRRPPRRPASGWGRWGSTRRRGRETRADGGA